MSRRHAPVTKSRILTDDKAVKNFLVRIIGPDKFRTEHDDLDHVFNYLRRVLKIEPMDLIAGPTARRILCQYGFDTRGSEDIHFLTRGRNPGAIGRRPENCIDWKKVDFSSEWLKLKQRINSLLLLDQIEREFMNKKLNNKKLNNKQLNNKKLNNKKLNNKKLNNKKLNNNL
jgi:hypothetical protein